MTCCSSSSASSPPNLPCGPPCSPDGGAPSSVASPSTSLSTAASATGIANAWPQSPRSFHRTLGQPYALTSACSVPTARSNPSSTSGSYPPPYISSRSSALKLDDVDPCRRPRSASRQRCAAPASAPAIFPRLMPRPPFFSLNLLARPLRCCHLEEGYGAPALQLYCARVPSS